MVVMNLGGNGHRLFLTEYTDYSLPHVARSILTPARHECKEILYGKGIHVQNVSRCAGLFGRK